MPDVVAMSDSRGPEPGIYTLFTHAVTFRNSCNRGGSSAVRVLPWVGTVQGNAGAFFESDLTLTNSGTRSADVELRYAAASGEGSGTTHVSLGPGEQMVAPSALEFLRAKGLQIPGGGSQGGPLRVTFAGLSALGAGMVGSRTASRGAGVWYPGSVPQGVPVLIGPIKEDDSDRTNLVLSHTGGPDAGEAIFRVGVTSTDPSAPGTVSLPDVRLKPGETRQLGRILSASGLAASSGYASVSLSDAAAPFAVHAIMNDNVTSDGSFVPGMTTRSVGYPLRTQTLVIPAVVEANDYATELFLVNAGHGSRSLRLEIPLLPGEGGVRPSIVLEIDLAGQSTRHVPDLFNELREQGLAPAKGSPVLRHVVITADEGDALQNIVAGARVWNPAPGGGRYGVYLPAVDIDTLPKVSALLAGLRQDESARSNLAITNVSDSSASEGIFRVDLYNGESGQKAAAIEDLHVPAGGFLQLNSVLASLAPGTKQGWARVTRIGGSGPFVTYAVVNDGARPGEGTGDGSVIMGQKSD